MAIIRTKLGQFSKGSGYWSGKKRTNFSNSCRKNMSKSHKGLKHSTESKLKMSLIKKGKPTWSKGLNLSKEHKSKIGLANSISQIGKKVSLETRIKMSDSRKGSKSQYWKGGISKKNRTERANIMSTIEYKLWREAVFARDKWTCIWCYKKSGNGKIVILQADHIKEFSKYPELRFAIDNGRTLCINCHKKRHKII